VKLSYLGLQAAVKKRTTPQNNKKSPKAGTARSISVSQFAVGVSQKGLV